MKTQQPRVITFDAPSHDHQVSRLNAARHRSRDAEDLTDAGGIPGAFTPEETESLKAIAAAGPELLELLRSLADAKGSGEPPAPAAAAKPAATHDSRGIGHVGLGDGVFEYQRQGRYPRDAA